MNIQKNKVVSVTYDLRTENHESAILESATVESPLKFIFGLGMMLPAFEENLNGKSQGDDFQFMLKANEAYGEFSEQNIIEIPKASFEVEGKIEDGLLDVGKVVGMQDQEGHRFDGKVLEIVGENVKMDFNHPMAGQDLYFTGKIIEVREASPEELDHGHVH